MLAGALLQCGVLPLPLPLPFTTLQGPYSRQLQASFPMGCGTLSAEQHALSVISTQLPSVQARQCCALHSFTHRVRDISQSSNYASTPSASPQPPPFLPAVAPGFPRPF